MKKWQETNVAGEPLTKAYLEETPETRQWQEPGNHTSTFLGPLVYRNTENPEWEGVQIAGVNVGCLREYKEQ